jgi:hypothetical protein
MCVEKYRVLRVMPSWTMKDFFQQENENEFIGLVCLRC